MKSFGLIAASLAFSSSAFAADVFVQQTRGSDLSRSQVSEVTGLVKNAVKSMPEHQLVSRANAADFVLQPTVLARGDEMILRIEKIKNGEVLAMSEETINSFDASRTRAMAVTETALQDNGYGEEYDYDDEGTSSATSQSADDVSSYSSTSDSDEASDQSADVAADTTESQGAIEMRDSRARTNYSSGQAVGRSPSAAAAAAPAETTNTATNTSGSPSVGELVAPSPRLQDPNRAGQIQIGVGPSFGIGMDTDNIMTDVMIGYAVDFTDTFVGKAFGDLNFGTGSEASRFLNFGVAGEYYPTRELLTFGKPYIGGDVGYAFTRDTAGQQADNLALGAGAGFKFQASELNWDVNAHYTILLDDINGDTPSVFGVRLALGF